MPYSYRHAYTYTYICKYVKLVLPIEFQFGLLNPRKYSLALWFSLYNIVLCPVFFKGCSVAIANNNWRRRRRQPERLRPRNMIKIPKGLPHKRSTVIKPDFFNYILQKNHIYIYKWRWKIDNNKARSPNWPIDSKAVLNYQSIKTRTLNCFIV